VICLSVNANLTGAAKVEQIRLLAITASARELMAVPSADCGRLTSLIVNGVKERGVEIGIGAYGRVFEVDYRGTICAAKEVHSILLRGINPDGSLRVKENFLRECQQCADLRHPNVVQFLGVYFRHGTPTPIMLMEKMNESLRESLERHQEIPVTAKLCILLDVALGLRYVLVRLCFNMTTMKPGYQET